MRSLLAVVMMCLLAGCGKQSPPTSALITKEQAEARTTVPLVRSLAPDDDGPMELEFDVPAQADDAEPPIFIGVRFTASDPDALADVADRLISSNILAFVHLERMQKIGSTSVPLEISRRIGWGQVAPAALGADGIAPGLFALDADVTTMQDAGLSSAATVSRELAFAYNSSLKAGHYRLKLRIEKNRDALVKANAQILIAYPHKGK
jgi:hypothetical protein